MLFEKLFKTKNNDEDIATFNYEPPSKEELLKQIYIDAIIRHIDFKEYDKAIKLIEILKEEN